jgi:hypothetical protein
MKQRRSQENKSVMHRSLKSKAFGEKSIGMGMEANSKSFWDLFRLCLLSRIFPNTLKFMTFCPLLLGNHIY